MNSKIAKEILIIVLLFMVIMFMIGILFYDCISSNNEEIASIDYTTDETVNNVLEEIESNSGVDVKNETSNSLLKSYSINANDLSTYASENSYESGKKDPFAEYAEPIEESVVTTTKGAEVNNSQNSNPIQTEESVNSKSNTVTNTTITNTSVNNKTESSTTSGTFFENKNSK